MRQSQNEIGKLKEFWLPLLLVCGASLLLVIIAQGDLGTGVALIAIILGMLLACGVPAKQYLLMLVIIVVGAVGATITSEHRMERIDAWVAVATGSEDIDDDTTYHIENAIMAMTGLIPVTGITFPLISYGGTSMVCVCFAIGLVLQVSCYTSRRTANQISGARSQIGDNLPTPRTPRKSRGNQ